MEKTNLKSEMKTSWSKVSTEEQQQIHIKV